MKRFVGILAMATLASLFYVFEVVEAVKIGYKIRRQQEQKIQLLDRQRTLKYNIARLKSPSNLEKNLLHRQISLQAPKEWQTLVLSDGKLIRQSSAIKSSLTSAQLFGRLFVGTAQAEAKEPVNQ